MSTFLYGAHSHVDIWVLTPHSNPSITGFNMVTPAAKRWASRYKEVSDPQELEGMIWVDGKLAGQILQDLANGHDNLDILMDETSGAMNA
jgi:hypothetical protein